MSLWLSSRWKMQRRRRRRREDRGDVEVGGESAAQSETVEFAGGEDIMAGAATAAAAERFQTSFGKMTEVQNLPCVRFATFILKKSDGTVGVPILRSKRVPQSEFTHIASKLRVSYSYNYKRIRLQE
uniref:Uncharacterized protein n=1 Tax=Oryza barthii TaxID=65489 RepID=A0A0D3HDR7_9ORYZ